jgi:hypothetical protein
MSDASHTSPYSGFETGFDDLEPFDSWEDRMEKQFPLLFSSELPVSTVQVPGSSFEHVFLCKVPTTEQMSVLRESMNALMDILDTCDLYDAEMDRLQRLYHNIKSVLKASPVKDPSEPPPTPSLFVSKFRALTRRRTKDIPALFKMCERGERVLRDIQMC